MSKIMKFALFGAAIVLVAVFAGTAYFTTNAHEMSPSIPAAVDSSDYFLRHPGGVMARPAAVDSSDYFLRHAGAVIARAAVDTSDYFLRHPEGVTTFAGAAPENARVDLEAFAVHAVAARSLYLSEKTLRARLYEAYERGPKSPVSMHQVQVLRRILNGRYERRRGGFPY